MLSVWPVALLGIRLIGLEHDCKALEAYTTVPMLNGPTSALPLISNLTETHRFIRVIR